MGSTLKRCSVISGDYDITLTRISKFAKTIPLKTPEGGAWETTRPYRGIASWAVLLAARILRANSFRNERARQGLLICLGLNICWHAEHHRLLICRLEQPVTQGMKIKSTVFAGSNTATPTPHSPLFPGKAERWDMV